MELLVVMLFVWLLLKFNVVFSVAATVPIVKKMHSIILISIILFIFLIITPPFKTPKTIN